MSEAVVILKKGEGRTIKAGGAWVYDNEIDTINGRFKNGEVVDVQDFDGYPMGKGYINQNSKIRVRMLTRKPGVAVDDEFLMARVKRAWDYRKAVMASGNNDSSISGIGSTNRPDLNCCRVVFGEADFLPGITIDKYADVLVVESLTLGMEQFKYKIVDMLRECLEADGIHIRAVVERSDAKEREKEGLKKYKGLMWSDSVDFSEPIEAINQEIPGFDPHVMIVENGVQYNVDVLNGQKTGFFLDQKYNRLAMQRVVSGALLSDENIGGAGTLKCLDCFTHMGTFALNMGLAGATDVTGLDISDFAVKQATDNAKTNGLSDRVRFRAANVLDELPKLLEAGEQYDVVVVDPPAFTKSKDATKNAIKGYREVNMKGLKLVRDGGYYATCSCSHFMTQDLFVKTIKEAAKASHKRLRQIEFRTQSCDHPILVASSDNVPESYYLKFLIFQVVDEK